MTVAPPDALLFDLDGTLADTAPDLIAALNRVRAGLDLPPMDLPELRNHASRGALGLLDAGLPEIAVARRADWREAFLDHYTASVWTRSSAFAGIGALLDALDAAGRPWGVVTNKPEALARAVLAAAGWLERSACLVGGDTVARPKPAPDPVLAACRGLGLDPARVAFVGDDRRDVDAGRAAGARTWVALWGYIDPGEDPRSWGADRLVADPAELQALAGVHPDPGSQSVRQSP